jgi:hypothetical protein
MVSVDEVIKEERLPAYINRRTAAEVISRHFFPVSHRTLEIWPVTYFLVNNKAMTDTKGILAVAREKIEASLENKGDGEDNG